MAEPPAAGVRGTGGDLVLIPRAGGLSVVATDRIHVELERLRGLRQGAEASLQGIRAAQSLSSAFASGGAYELRCADNLAAARHQLQRVIALSGSVHDSLVVSAHAYAETERAIERAQRFGAGLVVQGLARGARVAAPVAALAGLALVLSNPHVVIALALGGALLGLPRRDRGDMTKARDWILSNPQLVTSPAFVDLVRLAVSSSDDAILGALGLPAPVAVALGDDALGITGAALGAAAVVSVGALAGALRETPVEITRRGLRAGAADGAPAGSAERLRRIPEGENQIRLEKYTAPGEPPRWTVYVSPTVTFDVTGVEPFDMTANLHGVAGGSPASQRAVEAALRDAGAHASDEIHLVGFSQGGMIAARIAESGRWNTVALESYGAPVGNITLPEGLHGFTVRHSDDLVPATAGPDHPDSLVHVERRAFLPGQDIPPVAVPAHQKVSYAETARLIDAAASEIVRDELARLDAFGAEYLARPGGELAVYDYHAERGGRPRGGRGPSASFR